MRSCWDGGRQAASLRSPSQSVRNPTTWFQLGIMGDAGPASPGLFLWKWSPRIGGRAYRPARASGCLIFSPSAQHQSDSWNSPGQTHDHLSHRRHSDRWPGRRSLRPGPLLGEHAPRAYQTDFRARVSASADPQSQGHQARARRGGDGNAGTNREGTSRVPEQHGSPSEARCVQRHDRGSIGAGGSRGRVARAHLPARRRGWRGALCR